MFFQKDHVSTMCSSKTYCHLKDITRSYTITQLYWFSYEGVHVFLSKEKHESFQVKAKWCFSALLLNFKRHCWTLSYTIMNFSHWTGRRAALCNELWHFNYISVFMEDVRTQLVWPTIENKWSQQYDKKIATFWFELLLK